MGRKQSKWLISAAVPTGALVVFLVSIGTASAEIRTITATGEYRMGDNDTRTDAKRLALLDAKRLALEQAGTYIESISEVKNFELTNEEIRAYTAGVVEVVEHDTQDMIEGTSHVVRVNVTAKIDTDVVTRQIEAVRQNHTARAELLRFRAEREQLRQLLEMQTQEITALRSQATVERRARERQQTLTKAEVDELLTRAWTELAGTKGATLALGKTTKEARGRATQFVERALEIDPSSAAAHELMGTIMHEDKRYEPALKEYRKALAVMINTGPSEHVAGLHFLIGILLEDMGKADEAISEYRSDVLLEPNNAEAHQWLGVKLLDKGNRNEAIQELRIAVRLAPDRADFHSVLGEALRSVDLDTAIQEFRTAIRLNPNEAQFHKLLGSALLGKGNREGIISEYHTAARLKPDEAASTHWQLASALRHHGDLDGAIKEYQKSLELDPGKDSAAYDLSLIFVDRGNWEQAYVQFREMPNNRELWEPMAFYSFGVFLQDRGRAPQSVKAYREVLIRTPETPDTKWLIEAARRRLAELEH